MSFSVTARETGKIAVLELSGRLVMGEACTALDSQMKSLIDGGRFSLLLECKSKVDMNVGGFRFKINGLLIDRDCAF